MFPALLVLKRLLTTFFSFVTDPWKRNYLWWIIRYSITPRYKEVSITLPNGYEWIVVDIASFFSMYKAMFLQRLYDFESFTEKPFIIDCGANIGMSVLFFKTIYPKAKIIAFEPDPYIFSVLQKNIQNAGFKNVDLINKGVWNSETILSFHSDHADGGHISNDAHTTDIKTIDLKKFLQTQEDVTFLKMDIEGAEHVVVPHCLTQITAIPFLFIEYHSFADTAQNIGTILRVLEKKHYRIELHHELISHSPLKTRNNRGGMDHQIDIFAWKKK